MESWLHAYTCIFIKGQLLFLRAPFEFSRDNDDVSKGLLRPVLLAAEKNYCFSELS